MAGALETRSYVMCYYTKFRHFRSDQPVKGEIKDHVHNMSCCQMQSMQKPICTMTKCESITSVRMTNHSRFCYSRWQAVGGRPLRPASGDTLYVMYAYG